MRGILKNHYGRVSGVVSILAIGVLAFSQGCSNSKSPTGSGGSPAFTPKALQITVGDTVKWVGVSGSHTVTSGTGASDPTVGQLFDQVLGAGQTFSRVFSSAGVVSYFCRPHESMGMTGTVTISAVAAPKTVQVSTSGASFSPANVSINAGDAVKWTSSGSHTVTSGTGAADPSVGALFDEALSVGQTFQFTFTVPGVYHYFCRPHEGSGMKGTVTVTAVKPKTVVVNATS